MTLSVARRSALAAVGLAAVVATLATTLPAQAATEDAPKTVPATTGQHAPVRSIPKVARDWAAAWNSSDTTLLAGLFTRDGVYVDYALGKTMTGHDEITAWKVGTDERIADVHVKVLTAFQSGDDVAIEATYSGHVNGAPAAFAVPITTVLHLVHGRIASNHDNYSLSSVLSQSGLPASS